MVVVLAAAAYMALAAACLVQWGSPDPLVSFRLVLFELYGSEYEAYRARTRTWIP